MGLLIVSVDVIDDEYPEHSKQQHNIQQSIELANPRKHTHQNPKLAQTTNHNKGQRNQHINRKPIPQLADHNHNLQFLHQKLPHNIQQ